MQLNACRPLAHELNAVRRSLLAVRAGMAELVDALVLGTSFSRSGGSSPLTRTKKKPLKTQLRIDK